MYKRININILIDINLKKKLLWDENYKKIYCIVFVFKKLCVVFIKIKNVNILFFCVF